MSAKITASWLFGRFSSYGHPRKEHNSTKWHVRYNPYYTWCGLELAGVVERAWVEGPPDGPICTPCVHYFERAIGLNPVFVSSAVQRSRGQS